MSLKALRRRNVRIANSRWTAYAVAGAATSLAGLATAEAEIHYSGPVNFQFKGTLSHNFPLENGRSLHFFHNDLGSGRGIAHLIIGLGTSSLFAGDQTQNFSSAPFYFYRLGSHVNVSHQQFGASCKRTFSSSIGTVTYCYGGFVGEGFNPGGHFTEPGRGFIGFEFKSGLERRFGWVRVKTSGEGENNFIVLDYAWADGEPIETGQKQSRGNTQAVTKPGSLGLLATGATGLKAWRQRRGAGTP